MCREHDRVDINRDWITLSRPKCVAIPVLVLSLLYFAFGWSGNAFAIGGHLGSVLGVASSSIVIALTESGSMHTSRVKELVDAKNLFIATAAFDFAGLALHIFPIFVYAGGDDFVGDEILLLFNMIAALLLCFAGALAALSACKLSNQIKKLREAGVSFPETNACCPPIPAPTEAKLAMPLQISS